MIQTDLSAIAADAAAKVEENQAFVQMLKNMDSSDIDRKVFRLNEEIAPKIECTACGNCCKTLMVNVEPPEADRLASHLDMDRATFDERYVEKSRHSGRMLLNAIPCHFLEGNNCSVYPYRFAGCKEFPALDQPLFTKRLFTVFMHYGRCPIIYNVVEKLKAELGFT